MRSERDHRLLPITVFAAAGCLAALAAEQDYPARPIRFVTSAPVGAGDFVSRMLAQNISPSLGQTVIVDNLSSGVLGMSWRHRPSPTATPWLAAR